ncbi:MAG: hypothetical protein ACLSAF_19850 [Intestinimonas sp.]
MTESPAYGQAGTTGCAGLGALDTAAIRKDEAPLDRALSRLMDYHLIEV